MSRGYPFFTNIAIPIRPRHVNDIFDGRKTEELRTRMLPVRFDHRPIRAFIYETSPTSAFVGEVLCHSAYPVDPRNPYNRTLEALCINREEFVRYVESVPEGRFAWSHNLFGEWKYPRSYSIEDFGLNAVPQSWRYVTGSKIPGELQERVYREDEKADKEKAGPIVGLVESEHRRMSDDFYQASVEGTVRRMCE